MFLEERLFVMLRTSTEHSESVLNQILQFWISFVLRSPDLALLPLEMKCSVGVLLLLSSTNQRLRLAVGSIHAQVLTGPDGSRTSLEGQSARDEGEEQAQYLDVEAFSCRHTELRGSRRLRSLQVVFNHTHTGRTHTYNRHADER